MTGNSNSINFPTPNQKLTNYINNLNNYTNGELEDKYNSIEKVLQTENRLNTFNQTYQKKYIEYIKILCVLVFSIMCIWLCIIINKEVLLPEGFITFIITIIIAVTLIYIFYLYKNILKHNIIDYEQIQYYGPALVAHSTSKPIAITPALSINPNSQPNSCAACPANYSYNGNYCEYNYR